MIVYALADPVSREIRYVGETKRSAARRLAQHKRTARQQTTPPVNAWLRGLGCDPAMIEIESFAADADMHAAEVYWIEQFRAMGAKLLNIAPGGSTRVGYRHTEATKAKWSRERRGENAPMFGKRRTPEQKAVFSQLTKEMLARDGHPSKGKRRSPEARARMSAAQKARQAREKQLRELTP